LSYRTRKAWEHALLYGPEVAISAPGAKDGTPGSVSCAGGFE